MSSSNASVRLSLPTAVEMGTARAHRPIWSTPRDGVGDRLGLAEPTNGEIQSSTEKKKNKKHTSKGI